MSEIIKTILIDQPNIFRNSLYDLLRKNKSLSCCEVFDTPESAYSGFEKLQPDVAVIEASLPLISTFKLILQLHHKYAQTQFLICTEKDDLKTVFAAFAAGARGYLLKRDGIYKIQGAIIDLHRGGTPVSHEILTKAINVFQTKGIFKNDLTKRENEILELLGKGFRYKEISHSLNISMDTVRSHTKHIYKKLKVRSRTEAILEVQSHSNFLI